MALIVAPPARAERRFRRSPEAALMNAERAHIALIRNAAPKRTKIKLA